MLWNDKRTPSHVLTEHTTGQQTSSWGKPAQLPEPDMNNSPSVRHMAARSVAGDARDRAGSTYGHMTKPASTTWGGGTPAASSPPAARGFASAHEGMKRTAAASASTFGGTKPKSGLRKLAGKLGR